MGGEGAGCALLEDGLRKLQGARKKKPALLREDPGYGMMDEGIIPERYKYLRCLNGFEELNERSVAYCPGS